MTTSASKWWETILEFFYPSSCLGCEEALQYSYRELFCPVCHLSVTVSDCHLRSHHPLKERLNTLFPFDLVLSQYRFPNQSRTMEGMLQGLKYQNLKYIGFLEGEKYGKIIAPIVNGAGITALIPVPLHRRKKMSRGYNQSLEWAKGLSSATGIGVSENLVRRIKYTRSQTLLNKEERRKNIENAFRITTRNTRFEWNGEHHFLLADDVITSGITLAELATTMRNTFPRSRFSVCTLAFRDY